MLIKYLRLRGFTSYIDSEITFDTNESFISTIIAPNGSGKSSILDAITTALFYRARGVDNRGTGMDNLINNESNFFEITFEFIMDNNEYKIIRRKFKNGKHELEFYINNISQTEKIAETQEKIYSIIKMNYETFLDTICIGQGLSSNFMNKKPNERKDIFIEILDLNKFEVLEKYTKEEKKSLINKLEQLNNKKDILNESLINEDSYVNIINSNDSKLKIVEKDIENISNKLEKEKLRKAEYEINKKNNEQMINHKNIILKSLQDNKSKINNLKLKFEKTKDNINKTNEEINSFKEKLNNIHINDIDLLNDEKKKINDILEELINEKTNITNDKLVLDTKITFNNNQINILNDKYDKLIKYDKGICDFCGNEITKEHKEKHLNDIKTQISLNEKQNEEYNSNIKDLKDKLLNVKQKYNDEKDKLSKIEYDIKETNNNIILKEKLELNIQLNNDKLKDYNEMISSIKIDKKQIEKDIKNLNNELEQYKDIKNIEVQEFDDLRLERELNIKTNEKNNILTSNGIFNEKLKEINNNKEEIDKLNIEISDLEIKLKDYDSLIEAFGKKGIQANIIANVLPEIENEINNVLSILFNNSTTIEFITQKDDTKSKVKSSASLETLDIVIHDKDKDRTYATYSGGEKFRIDFACHIGLSKFLTKRAKANIDFFMIDEGLGSQDEEGRENFILTVNKISSLFKQIFIITHIDELKDAFDKKIIINKDPINGSKIEVV